MAFVSVSATRFGARVGASQKNVCFGKRLIRRATWTGCARISHDEVVKTAKLAQLELKDDEVEQTTEEFRKIIDFFNTMSQLDLQNVEPMARPSEGFNMFRNDEPKQFDDIVGRYQRHNIAMETESPVPAPQQHAGPSDPAKQQALREYRRVLLQHREADSRVRALRQELKSLKNDYDKTEDDLKALQSVGQIIGEVLRQLDAERFIVKASSGPRYVVGCRNKLDKAKMSQGTRVSLDMTTLTIMRQLPREVDPLVHNMLAEDPGSINYAEIGGLSEQIRQLREVVELPLTNPELFQRVGIKAPKGVLLFGPPGTGKTLLARAISSNIDAAFLKVVASAIVDKYIGESARVIREMFNYARDHQPCIIFMDEIDAIGGRRFSEGTSADREIQRTLMELLNQLDGFDELGKVKLIMATNRPDVLDPALLRPGRLDRKMEIPLPNEQARLDILKIHAGKLTKHGDIDYEAVVKLSDGFNGADLRNICTEAGLFAIRDERSYVIHEDFMKGVRKLADKKRLEGTLEYSKNFTGNSK